MRRARAHAWSTDRNPWLSDSSASDSALGSLFTPWDDRPIGQVHAAIAAAYGVPRAFVSTNGTTTANRLALYTLLNPGEHVLVERDCHISILQTIVEIGALPVWLVPPFAVDLGINLAALPEALAAQLDRAPQIRAVVLTSPKYFGVVGDLPGCIAACHRRGVPVLVDEAHGACLAFHPALPASAVHAGADLVTQSTHKLTEAWSQGAVLLFNNAALTDRFLQALHGIAAVSTSFNYGIVASVEEAITNLTQYGARRLEVALRLAQALRDGIGQVPGLATWGAEQADRPGFVALDATRVTVNVTGLARTGIDVKARLAQRYRHLPPVVAELGDTQNVLFLVGYGNRRRDIATLLAHLHALAASRPAAAHAGPVPAAPRVLPPRALDPRAAYWAVARGQTHRVSVAGAIGQIAGETVAVYPPGNALVVQGEVVLAEVVDYLQQMATLGAHLKGASDPAFRTMRILA